jgi:pimeloyl-ACP methyl ester carboxylesterase
MGSSKDANMESMARTSPLSCFRAANRPKVSRFIKSTDQDNLVVFLHGITGDPEKTWFNKHSGAYWPTLLTEDPDFGRFDVFVVSYPSPFLGRASTIEENATRLLQQFQDGGLFDRFKQIYFIAHSMGGLIIKRMLVDLNRESRVEQLRLVRAVLFLSTPAQGSSLARVAAWFTSNPQFADLRSAVSNTYLQAVDNQWETLLRDRNEQQAMFPKLFCAYETRKTALAFIVSRIYAKTASDENPYPMDLAHGGIAKPFGKEGDPYEWAKAKILKTAALDGGQRLPRTRPPHAEKYSQALADVRRSLKELEYKLSAYKGNGELDSLQENLREKGLSQNPFTVYLRPALKSILEDPDKRALLDGQCIETLEELYSRPRFTIQETLIKLAVIQNQPGVADDRSKG